MGIAQKIELKQRQKPVMSPRLTQAIHLLKLGGPELDAYLEREIEKNPLLELPPSRSRNDGFSAQETLGESETRLQNLHRQIGLMPLPAHIAHIAKMLAGELSNGGYLRSPVFELADRLKVSTRTVETALTALQACEPVGIGARSVAECLELQLKAKGRFDPVMAVMLDNLLLVAKNDISALATKTGEPEDSVQEMLAEIRALAPHPGAALLPAPVVEVVPEVQVTQGDMGMWQVALIEDALPKVLIDQNYVAEISKYGEAAADFSQQNLEMAHWMIKALDQRAHTILKVAAAIVAHQYAWFEKGDMAMRPLTLSIIAAKVGMHESTVSRVTAGKFLTCHRGTYELKHFFTAKIPAIDGKSEFSALGVRARIKHLISQESYKNTLSDDDLVNILRSEGADIARRTVAKYREVMGVGSSLQRRKKLQLRQVDNKHKRP